MSKSQLIANTIHITYRASLLQLADALSPYPFLREQENELRNIADNLQTPFNIAIFGRMKTGKSTLINALIGKQLCITGTEETTATINRISYATGDKLQQFTAHWQDSQPESFPLERLLRDWSGTQQEVLNRIAQVAWLDLYSDAKILTDIHLTDTPGTGSSAVEHEKIAKQFINGQEADALLYVFAPIGRESDKNDLEAFRAGCLPGASLDNSIAVLHKWDTTYWDEDNWESILSKAKRIQECMKDCVSTVIPVSAPLALLSKTAPKEFWKNCLTNLQAFDDEEDLLDILRGDSEEWEDEPQRKALKKQAKELGCPFPSFSIMMRHLYRHPSENPAEVIYKLSGLKELEEILDCQILSQRAIIQQKQNCARAKRIIENVTKEIEKELQRQKEDMSMLTSILHLLNDKDSKRQQLWIADKYDSIKQQHKELNDNYLALDELRIRVDDWAKSIMDAHDLIPWLKEFDRLGLKQETAELFTSYLKRLIIPSTSNTQDISNDVLMGSLGGLNKIQRLPSKQDRDNALKLRGCLMYLLQKQSNH